MQHPRVLFYCQHLLGIGHLSRSLALVGAMVEDGFEVDFVQGGPDIGRHPAQNARLRLVQLPPLLMEEESSRLYDPLRLRSVAEVFEARKAVLENLCAEKTYDVVMTELFPFGRGKFKAEILNTISSVRTKNPRAIRVSSVRDILVRKNGDDGAWEEKIVGLARESFDRILVHSDESVVRFEETFSHARALVDRLAYTGFVTEGRVSSAANSPRKNEILVSLGGGAVGDELALATAHVASDFADFSFRFLLGPYASPHLPAQLLIMQSPNVEVVDFLSVRDFEAALSRCALSISLAGYNTLMNLLSTRTPALVYPYDRNAEQRLRAGRLQDLNFLKVLEREDLEPGRLCGLIRDSLFRIPPELSLRLDGANASVLLIREWTKGNLP